jgi:A/G-specific adenine glycosylase
MRKREGKDIWHGLYDFELIETTKPFSKAELAKELMIKNFEITTEYKHILTHQIIYARFIFLKEKATSEKKQFYSPKRIAELPKPVLISKFLADYRFLK